MYEFQEIRQGILLNIKSGEVFFHEYEALSIANNQTSTSSHNYSPSQFKQLLKQKSIRTKLIPTAEIQFALNSSGSINSLYASETEDYPVIARQELTQLIDVASAAPMRKHDENLPYEELGLWGVLVERATDDIYYSMEHLIRVVNGGNTSVFTGGESKQISSSTIRKKVESFATEYENDITKKIPNNLIDHWDLSAKPILGNSQERYVNSDLFTDILNHFTDGLGSTTKGKTNVEKRLNINPVRRPVESALKERFNKKTSNDANQPINIENAAVPLTLEDADAIDQKIYNHQKKIIKQAENEVQNFIQQRDYANQQAIRYLNALREVKQVITTAPFANDITNIARDALLNTINVN